VQVDSFGLMSPPSIAARLTRQVDLDLRIHIVSFKVNLAVFLVATIRLQELTFQLRTLSEDYLNLRGSAEA
jgi:hypothetical protein